MKYLLLLFSFFTSVLFSQTVKPDTIIVNNLSFDNEVEKRLFEEYLNGDTEDLFGLFYAVGCHDNFSKVKERRAIFNRAILDFKSEKYQHMKPEKFAKVFYKNLHNKYFNKYEVQIMFNDVFKDGRYNCVTASAIFGLYFEELGYNYAIKLIPGHVYLTLFPDKESIKIETTNPLIGSYVIDNKYKKDFINYLVDSKIISKAEFEENSIDELFELHFNKEEEITLENLVGVLYYNSGLKYFEDEDYLKAFNQFEKAHVFYAAEVVEYMMTASLGNYFILNGVKDRLTLRYIAKYLYYAKNEPQKILFLELFGLFTQHVLIEQGDFNNYKDGYKYLKNAVSDSSMLSELGYIYNYELGRNYYNTGKIKESQECFKNAFLIKPDNLDAQSAIIEILAKRLSMESLMSVVADIENLYENNATLKNNNAFCNLYAHVCLGLCSQYFRIQNSNSGIKYLDKFEIIHESHPSLELNSNAVSDAYSSIAVYYFGKGNVKLAKKYIDKGLEITPHNFNLLHIRQTL
ncbi:MAG: hypothetical protein JXA77_15985 [Bacteroidales bacterium]|nr:hypothetical protein [Bacteroidales bacterium]MBN2817485.1 hypothetical protein [Bacteroidales bacterium]